jgi:hypothetical protein
MQQRISGTIRLDLSVDAATGDVQDGRIISGHPIFFDAVKEAARGWQFMVQPGGEARILPADLVFE